jgi:hypothetical protein
MNDFYQFKNTRVGLGLFEEKYGGSTLCGHTGRQLSYISFAFVNTQTKQSVVILTNNANDPYADKIIEQLCARK